MAKAASHAAVTSQFSIGARSREIVPYTHVGTYFKLFQKFSFLQAMRVDKDLGAFCKISSDPWPSSFVQSTMDSGKTTCLSAPLPHGIQYLLCQPREPNKVRAVFEGRRYRYGTEIYLIRRKYYNHIHI